MTPVISERDTFYGREETFDAYRAWLEPWGELRREPRELIDLGDRVVVLIEESGRGAGSGIEASQLIANVHTLGPRGVIVKHVEYNNWESALDAAGVVR